MNSFHGICKRCWKMFRFIDESSSVYFNHRSAIDEPPSNIERIAVENRSSLGMCYDIYDDKIYGRFSIMLKGETKRIETGKKCMLFSGASLRCQNLLELVDIDPDLRLSIRLNMMDANGIASLINYSRPINENTRLLYIYRESYIKSLGREFEAFREYVRRYSPETLTTHIVTEIVFGIHALIILQLPTTKTKEIDQVLSKIQENLSFHGYKCEISEQDMVILNQISSTTAYSNLSNLTQLKTLEEVYEKIMELEYNEHEQRPIKYILSPLYWFYGRRASDFPYNRTLKIDETENIENLLIQQTYEIYRLTWRVTYDLKDLLQGRFSIHVNNILNMLSTLKFLQKEENEYLATNIYRCRSGETGENYIGNKYYSNGAASIQNVANEIIGKIEELESRGKLVKQIENEGFEYWDIAEFNIDQNITKDQIIAVLLKNNCNEILFFSSERLRKREQTDWDSKCSQIISKTKDNPNLRLVYADFTDSTFQLEQTEYFAYDKTPMTNSKLQLNLSIKSVKSNVPSMEPIDKDINILLLGESGVGKSTFINAFANYLRFKSLDDAERGKCVVVIPVSFVITVGDNFDEQIIRFGENDSNENFNDFGQSVTQQCRAYVFKISNEQRIRFIDTPGFGDTRGSDQDVLNMENIFHFLHHINHINGICFLYKPEVAQLNPFIRSCFTQLFNYFGEKIRDSFIFCFTNTRSTFYAPGSTGPLLRQFFDSFPIKHIPFGKANTFCFDSESFRYLIAKNNSIDFNDSERKEFIRSWEISAKESRRFSDFLFSKSSYRKNEDWKSFEDAKFQLNILIRPILETIRNILRNMISIGQPSIELNATPVQSESYLCYECNRYVKKCGSFGIWADNLHSPISKCTAGDQKIAQYRLNYSIGTEGLYGSIESLKWELDSLCTISTMIARFLMKYSRYSGQDPFKSGLERMIKEEHLICINENNNDSNEKLIKQLQIFEKQYENEFKKSQFDAKQDDLSAIYEIILFIKSIPMLNVQINAIKSYQEQFLLRNECEIDINN